MLNFFLNKGGAGVSLSRSETVEHLNPLMKQLIELNNAYDTVIRQTPDREIAAQLEAFQKVSRTDVSKLAETVLSAGGVPFSGAEIEPDPHSFDNNHTSVLQRLFDSEQAFLNTVAGELKLDHQVRTRAILTNLQRNSEARLSFLKDKARQAARTTGGRDSR